MVHMVRMFSTTSSPPLLRGTIWSFVIRTSLLFHSAYRLKWALPQPTLCASRNIRRPTTPTADATLVECQIPKRPVANIIGVPADSYLSVEMPGQYVPDRAFRNMNQTFLACADVLHISIIAHFSEKSSGNN